MAQSFRTELGQLQQTTKNTTDAVGALGQSSSRLEAAVNNLGRFSGEFKDAFLNQMGINLPELKRLNGALQQIADNLGMTNQGAVAQESAAAGKLRALQDQVSSIAAPAASAPSLSGPPLNR